MPCYGLPGAFQHPEVVIGWYRCVATRDVEIRSAPGPIGRVLKVARKSATIGRQSVRNPTSSPTPPRREPILWDGKLWVWVYTLKDSITGWCELDALQEEIDLSRVALKGPGGYDFEVGRTLPLAKKKNGCGTLSPTRPSRVVTAITVYLRYSGRGTAFHTLHKDDRVRILIANAPAGYCFVEVLAVGLGSGAKVGSRGWTTHGALA